MTSPIHIVFSDLDGTLLKSDRTVSSQNIGCLEKLGKIGITRVIATGRSLYSVKRVLRPDFPADYLIFSSGAGIVDLHSQEMLFTANLYSKDIETITTLLLNKYVDFMVHKAVPENHHFIYQYNSGNNPDFARRIELYKDYAVNYSSAKSFPSRSAQVIVILADNFSRFSQIETELAQFQIVRTTSPLDHQSLWMEIFPAHVSKGMSADWLCKYVGLEKETSLGIGNDYNDISLLDFTATSYVVDNAPQKLKTAYQTTLSNDDSGFAHVIEHEVFSQESRY